MLLLGQENESHHNTNPNFLLDNFFGVLRTMDKSKEKPYVTVIVGFQKTDLTSSWKRGKVKYQREGMEALQLPLFSQDLSVLYHVDITSKLWITSELSLSI